MPFFDMSYFVLECLFLYVTVEKALNLLLLHKMLAMEINTRC